MKRLTLLLLFGIILSLSIVNAAWSDTLNSNLLAYWTFNETTGNIIDRYDFNNNFTQFLGSYNRNSNGIIGGSDQYSADGGVLNMTQMVGINSSKVGTISFWINSTAIGNNLQYAVSTFQGTSSFTFEFDNRTGLGSRMMFTFGSSWQVTALNGSLSMLRNNWTHVALVQDGNYPVIYVNGKNYTGYYLNKADTTAWLDDLNLGFLGLGYLPGGYTRLNVSFDEMGIWNRSLSASEIETLYNSGNGITYSPTTFTINLNLPTDNSAIDSTNYTFNSSLDPKGDNLVNATIEIWYSNGTLFNSTTNIITGTTENHTLWTITNFTLGENMTWNVFGCTSSQCKYSGRNFTFLTASILESYPATLIEGEGTRLDMNITFSNINTNIESILTWNNTDYETTKNIIDDNTVQFTASFVVPTGIGNSTGRIIEHYWRYYLPDGSLNKTTTAKTQQVYTFQIDDCTTFTNVLYNFTLLDEQTRQFINETENSTIDLYVLIKSSDDPTKTISFNKSYNYTNIAQVCLGDGAINSTGFLVDLQAKYSSQDYVTEYYNIQSATLTSSDFPQNIPLYDLKTTQSQEFLITFKDNNFVPVSNALIEITRQYLPLGTFLVVEIPKTDTDGNTIAHLVLNEEIYTINVRKNGVLLATFENVRAFCSDVTTGNCRIALNAISSTTGLEQFISYKNASYSSTYNQDTRTYAVQFSSLTSTSRVFNLTMTVFDNYENNTFCSRQTSANSGVFSCVIPGNINGTVIAKFSVDGEQVYSEVFNVIISKIKELGYIRFFMAFIFLASLAALAAVEGIILIVIFLVGFVFVGVLGFLDLGILFGTGSAFLWLLIAGGIIVWKAVKSKGG